MCVTVGVQTEHSECVLFSFMLIPPYRAEIPAACMCWPPPQSGIPWKFLCHVFSQGGQALLLQNSHPCTGLYHTHIHPSGVSVWHKQNNNKKTEEFPFLLPLFAQWRLGYKNEECCWITFGALSTCCSNIYETTLWILFLYGSEFLLMSHTVESENADTTDESYSH